MQAFKTAFESFKKGTTAVTIKRLLSFRAPNFVVALKSVIIASEVGFAQPVGNGSAEILGKRFTSTKTGALDIVL